MRRYLVLGVVLVGCSHAGHGGSAGMRRRPATGTAALIVQGARDQLTWGTSYDAAYRVISYPGGDIPRDKGACSDVVVRALRNAGFDLQKLMHKDMETDLSAYPKSENREPDPNIDQRRVANQRVFFKRYGVSCTLDTNDPNVWQPGDIVEWKMWSGKDHTGVLTDLLDPEGFPCVIHNIGNGPQEEDVLRAWGFKVAGHFRYPKPKSSKQQKRSAHRVT